MNELILEDVMEDYVDLVCSNRLESDNENLQIMMIVELRRIANSLETVWGVKE